MKDLSHLKKYLSISFILFAFFAVIAPRSGHPWDVYCWAEWSNYTLNNGLGSIYNSGTDYLPLYHYILNIYGAMQGSRDVIYSNIHYLKLFTLIFHFITGYFVYLFVKRENESWDSALLNTLYYLVNIAVLYNVIIWSQVDIILTCFVFISVYFAIHHKALLSVVFLVVALNFKLHAVIFFPVIGLLLLPDMVQSFSFKKSVISILVVFVLQFLIVLPFILGGSIQNLPGVITGSVGKFSVISAYAFNLWHLLLKGDLANLPDTVVAFGLTYNTWGLLLFFTSSFIALFPFLKQVYVSLKTKKALQLPIETILITCALIPVLFFYFNTQMHERYSHPALVFLITYGILQKKPLLPVIASVAYFLNLEAELKFLALPKYSTLIFDSRFISVLWLMTMLGLYLQLYGVSLKTVFGRLKK